MKLFFKIFWNYFWSFTNNLARVSIQRITAPFLQIVVECSLKNVGFWHPIFWKPQVCCGVWFFFEKQGFLFDKSQPTTHCIFPAYQFWSPDLCLVSARIFLPTFFGVPCCLKQVQFATHPHSPCRPSPNSCILTKIGQFFGLKTPFFAILTSMATN